MSGINTGTTAGFPQDAGGSMVAVGSATTVDNIFVFQDPSGQKWRRVIDGIYRASWAGVFGTGDKTTIVQTIINNASVHSILFDIPYGNVSISGTSLNCNGKKLIFKNGSKIIGTNTINAPLIDCDLTDQCFTIGTTLTNATSTKKEFSCENFGAVGNGSDETAVLQHTSDTLIANSNMPRTIKLLCGKIYGTQGWILHNWNGTDYGQFALNIIGEKSAFGGNPAFSPTVKQLNARGFGIGIQRATGVSIEGIGVQGPLNIASYSNDNEWYTRPYSTWASTYGGSTKLNAPDCNIAIDPFRMNPSLPGDNGYDDWNGLSGATAMNPTGVSWYRGTQTSAGSTATKLRDLNLNGATVLVCVSPNGESQQCENMTFEDIYGNNCKAVYGFCQRESKNCVIKGGYSIDRVFTILDGASWGAQRGSLPFVEGYCTSGYVIQFIEGGSAQHPVSFSKVYMENAYRIGDMSAGAGMTQFLNCNFVFNSTVPVPYPPTHFNGLNVQFKGCTMRYYDDLFNKRLTFAGAGISFEGCFFDLPPLSTVGYDYNGNQRGAGLEINESYYGSSSVIGWRNVKGYLANLIDSHIPTGPVTYENFDPEPPYLVSNSGRIVTKYDMGNFEQLDIVFVAATYTANTAAHTAVFTAWGYDSPPVGSYIIITVNVGGTFGLLGRVASVVNNICQIVDVPMGFPDGPGTSSNYYAKSSWRVLRNRFIGNYSAGTFTITNCYNTPAIGAKDIYTNYVVVGVTGSTVTLSGLVGITGRLYTPSADKEDITYYKVYTPYDDPYFPDTTPYYPGDKWVFNPFNSAYITATAIMNRKFKCVKEGVLGTAIWEEIYDGEFKDVQLITINPFAVTEPIGRYINGMILSSTNNLNLSAGTSNGGGEIFIGTLLSGTSQTINWSKYFDTNTNIWFNGTTGGTLTAKFF